MRYAAVLDEVERATIIGLMEQVRELLAPEDLPQPRSGDEFDEIVAGLGRLGGGIATEDEDGAGTARHRPGVAGRR